jgi:4-hydroxybenzoate polyprenyltransferase
LPLIPIPALNFAKKAGVLKTVILAFTWMYVTAFLPVQKYILHLNALHYLLIANRFLFLLMLCIIFDSRDIDIDKMRGLHSLATDVKKGNLRLVFYCTTITLVLINILLIRNGISVFQSAGLQIAVLATLIAYKCSFQQQGYIFYYFIVDGLMIFSALATFIASI